MEKKVYKVGDTVIISDNARLKTMSKYYGKTATVTQVLTLSNLEPRYRLDIDDGDLFWIAEDFKSENAKNENSNNEDTKGFNVKVEDSKKVVNITVNGDLYLHNTPDELRLSRSEDRLDLLSKILKRMRDAS